MSFKTFRANLRRRWSIHKTIHALNQLENHELDDLGIGRWQIPDIARRGFR